MCNVYSNEKPGGEKHKENELEVDSKHNAQSQEYILYEPKDTWNGATSKLLPSTKNRTEVYTKSFKSQRFKLSTSWDFPGNPVVKTPSSQCRGPGFHP